MRVITSNQQFGHGPGDATECEVQGGDFGPEHVIGADVRYDLGSEE